MDACEFLSSDVFKDNPEVVVCQKEDDIDGTCTNSDADECRISMSTMSYEKSIQRNVVDLFRVTSLSVDEIGTDIITEKVLTKYRKVRDCANDFFRDVKTDLSSAVIDRIISKLDLNLITGEGDLLHQHLDCIFMGAYTKTFFAPTDSNMVLEPMMYSRHKNGTSREFDIPCAPTMVYDTHAENIEESAFSQKTCGSEVRIGVMAFAKQNIVKKENSLNFILAKKIKEKIANIEKSFQDIDFYGCKPTTSWKECCEIPGKCKPTESIFEPSIAALNFEISGSELLHMLLDSIKTIQRDILYDSSVRILFFCTCESIISIND